MGWGLTLDVDCPISYQTTSKLCPTIHVLSILGSTNALGSLLMLGFPYQTPFNPCPTQRGSPKFRTQPTPLAHCQWWAPQCQYTRLSPIKAPPNEPMPHSQWMALPQNHFLFHHSQPDSFGALKSSLLYNLRSLNLCSTSFQSASYKWTPHILWVELSLIAPSPE